MMRVWRLMSDVCPSVAYIGPKSGTERPRKTKIGTEVAHVTRDSDTTFKIKRSTCRGWGICGGLPHSDRLRPVCYNCVWFRLLSLPPKHWSPFVHYRQTCSIFSNKVMLSLSFLATRFAIKVFKFGKFCNIPGVCRINTVVFVSTWRRSLLDSSYPISYKKDIFRRLKNDCDNFFFLHWTARKYTIHLFPVYLA